MIYGLVCRYILMHVVQCRLFHCYLLENSRQRNHEANRNYETHRRKYTEGSSLLECYFVPWIKDFLAFQNMMVPLKRLEPL